MKRIVMFALCLLLVLAGCGKKTADAGEQTGTVGVVNPVRSSTAEEILEKDGVAMQLPAGAENARWSRITMQETVLAQVTFELEGESLCFRAQKTAGPEDISGMYYEWGQPEGGEVPADAPRCFVNETGQGVLLWYADGVSFSLSMSENASADILTAVYGEIAGA